MAFLIVERHFEMHPVPPAVLSLSVMGEMMYTLII